MNIWYTITGGIDSNTAHQLITWVNSQIYQGTITKLTIFISSGGGDIDSAIRAYHFLKGLPVEVETIGISQIDSAANTIFLAGQNRKALNGCRFFLHEGTFTIGNPSASLHSLEETLTILKALENRNIEIVVRETGKNEQEIKNAMVDGKILTSQEAVEFGLATEVISQLPNGPSRPSNQT